MGWGGKRVLLVSVLLRAEEEVGVHLSTIPRLRATASSWGKTPGQNAQKWIPARSTRRDDNSAANNSANEKERHDAIFRKVRG